MYQSVETKKGMIFVLNLNNYLEGCCNIMISLKKMLNCVQLIENAYPNTFNYRFNGRSIEIMALIPYKNPKLSSLFGRYGSVRKFYRILLGELYCLLNSNLKLNKQNNNIIRHSILKHNIEHSGYRTTFINYNDTPKMVLEKSMNPIFEPLKTLNMKFWIKQLNPDMMDYRKKYVLEEPKETIDLDKLPPCIKNIMNLKDKPPNLKFFLMKYLLLNFRREDAKEALLTCLNDIERNKLETGGIEERWDYAISDLHNNTEPSCRQLKDSGVCSGCKRVSPYEEE